MFCPNCGQDCGDAKFCTGCGTQLKQATENKLQKAAWTVGTPCPYCGGVGLNGNCCAFCGVQLISEDTVEKETKKELKFPEPPIGKYTYGDGYLEISKDSVTIYQRPFPIFKARVLTIPFNEIAAVSFGDGQFDLAGFLCVRNFRNKSVPLITRASNAVSDRGSVHFRSTKSKEFYPVYEFLRQCAKINNIKREELLNDN